LLAVPEFSVKAKITFSASKVFSLSTIFTLCSNSKTCSFPLYTAFWA